METLLVKMFATALALSQVTTAPDAVATRFDRVADQGAVAQQLRHRPLIGHPVEPCRNCVRRRRHLAKRKRSGKHLDEERFHAGPGGCDQSTMVSGCRRGLVLEKMPLR